MSTNEIAATEEKLRPIHIPHRDEGQTGYLVRLLSDDDPGNCWKAAQALGRMQDMAAVGALFQALYDDWRVQQKAVWAIGSIGRSPRDTAPSAALQGGRWEPPDLIVDAEEMIRCQMYRPD